MDLDPPGSFFILPLVDLHVDQRAARSKKRLGRRGNYKEDLIPSGVASRGAGEAAVGAQPQIPLGAPAPGRAPEQGLGRSPNCLRT